jgi:hypothetical protein
MSTTPAAVLATVERSPAAVAGHDRQAWVGLFTADGRVEDPVGSRPHIGRDQLARFYDTFIGPRTITFHRDVDIVAGSTVLRDLVLEVAMGSRDSACVTMHIPAILRYDVQSHGGELRIAALRAYWELPAMAVQFARCGVAAVPAGLRLTATLLRNQGLVGAAGFMAGIPGVGTRGKRLVSDLLADTAAGDEVAVKRRLGSTPRVTAGDDAVLPQSELVGLLAGTRVRTLLAAGRSVAARLSGGGRDLVLIAEFGTHPTALRRLRVFADDR